MTDGLKLTGAERRQQLLAWLKESEAPLTGSELAKRASVSRQVIVQDISLLKAKTNRSSQQAKGTCICGQPSAKTAGSADHRL